MVGGPTCQQCGQRSIAMLGGTLCAECISSTGFDEITHGIGEIAQPITDPDELVSEASEATGPDGLAAIFARYTPPADEMDQQVVREKLLGVLTGKVSSPAKMVDAWLNRTPDKDAQRLDAAQAARLVRLVLDHAELFADPHGEPYATINFAGRRETHHIRKRRFRMWITKTYFDDVKRRRASDEPRSALGALIAGAGASPVPSAQAVRDAITQLEGLAVYEGQQHEVHVRVAALGMTIYVDLGNEAWEAVKITSSGWTVVTDPPVKFIRPEGMLPLPNPVPGGELGDLRRFINVTDEDWPLVAGFIISMFHPHGPYPILNLHGEQGSAKSSAAKWLRRLVDPYSPIHRGRPRNEHDLVIAASRAWVLSFDNLSAVAEWFSDALARLSTGGGFGARQLYSDDEERRFDDRRPIILNGIEELATRPDLLDRSILVTLPQLQEYVEEATLEQEFTAAWPQLLGACLDAAVWALGHAPNVKIPPGSEWRTSPNGPWPQNPPWVSQLAHSWTRTSRTGRTRTRSPSSPRG
jgi:hypothetical protein